MYRSNINTGSRKLAFFDEQHKALIDQLAASATNGGIAVVGLHFPSCVTQSAFDNFFSSGFDLPWKRGAYHRTDFQLQRSCVLPRGVSHSSFPPPYSMKVLHVRNARPRERIFVPVSGATTQSHVLSAEPVDASQAAVTGAKIGNGYLAYCGDVNAEAGSTL
ncbi:hypothetical protein PDE_09479 [Penicillium oxalicum 114-2]|uniref:Uncharacterized protein n=1 Tax=Penicillium oxalicum (strain 114-2 / CGMCC 5302) TaxID=933388 RepID=S7ZUV4_PENO1|nr:hypothetical protein PDE_09479 [Penicillium oxalicum 114-2]